MFMTPRDLPDPFATNILEAVQLASSEDKPAPALKEEDFTSLLFPGDSEGWEDVASTFSVGKHSADCFSQQFNESLPKLPESLITREFDTRTRLARSLHTFTLTKYMLSRDAGYNLLKVLVKSLVNTLKNDLSDFMQARRAYRNISSRLQKSVMSLLVSLTDLFGG